MRRAHRRVETGHGTPTFYLTQALIFASRADMSPASNMEIDAPIESSTGRDLTEPRDPRMAMTG